MCNDRPLLSILLLSACLAVFPVRGNCSDEVPAQCGQIWELLQKARTKTDMDVVVSKYQEALRHYGKTQDSQGQSEVMCGLGWVYLRQGNYLLADRHFETALDYARKRPNSGLQSKSLNGIGLIRLFQERLEEARNLFEQSLGLANQNGDPQKRAAALHCTAMMHKSCGDYAQAQKTAEKALDDWGVCHDQIGECDSLINLGAALSAQSKRDIAKANFQNALATARTAGYRWGEGWALFNLAYIAWQSKEYDQAGKYGTAALEIAMPLGDLRLAAHVNNCLGLAFMDSGQLDKAAGFYDSARSLANQVGLPGLSGWVENNMGYLLFLRRQHHAAQEHLNRAMDIAAQNHNRDQFMKARANLTQVYMAIGRFDNIAKLAARPVPTTPCGKKPHLDATQCLAHLSTGDVGRASDCAEQALKDAREINDTNGQTNALIILVMTGYYTGMGEAAERNLKDLKKLAYAMDDPGQKTTVLAALVSILSSLGRHNEAGEILDRMGNAAASITDPQVKIAALALAGISFYSHENDKKALTLFHEAINLAKQTGSPSPVIPFIGFYMGRIQLRLGNEAGAISAFQMGVTAAQLTRNRFAESLALSALADRLRVIGYYQEALGKYGDALNLAEQISYPIGQAEALQGMAEVYEELGDYDQAIKQSQNALAFRRHVRDARTSLYIETERALYSINLNDSEAAVKQLNKVIAEDYEKALGSTTITALAYLGQLWARRGEAKEIAGRPAEAKEDFAMAEKQFEKSIEMAKDKPNVEQWTRRMTGLFYLDRGELDKAESYLTLAGNSSSLGKLYLAKRDYRSAREQFDKMLSTPQQLLRVNSIFVANTGLGKAFEGLQDYTLAATYYQRAIDTVEYLRSTPSDASKLRFMNRTIDIFPRSEPYKGLARVLYLSSVSEESWKKSLEASEYCKARSLADALANGMSKGALSGDLEATDVELNTRLKTTAEAEIDAIIKNDPEKIAAARIATEKAREALRNHIDALWRNQKTRPYAMVRYPRPPKLEEADVKTGEAIVVYEVSDHDLFIYVVTKEGEKNVVRAIRKEGKGKACMQEVIRRFRAPFEFPSSERLADHEVTFDFAAARELYGLLMSDVVELRRKPDGSPMSIIVIPDGQLATIPFDALVTSSGGSVIREKKEGIVKAVGATFLSDLASISYAQSLTTLTMARAAKKSRTYGSGTLVLWYGQESGSDAKTPKKASGTNQQRPEHNDSANPTTRLKNGPIPALPSRVELPTDLQFRPLEYGKELESELQTAFGVGAFRADKNRERDWFKLNEKEEPLDKENIFFYTHGVFSQKLREPALAVHHEPRFHDDLLFFSDVMASRKLKADFVVLAACVAGLGHYISGEGVMGMSAAIQYSWSNRVLTTLWEIPEYSTLEMMKSLAEYLSIPGSNKRTAFELARRNVRQRWDHPYYWAPFMFLGSPD